jgi:hypothetical protein
MTPPANNPKRAGKVRFTGKTIIYVDEFSMLRLNAFWVGWDKFRPGDRVKVTVEHLPQPGKKRKAGV